MDVAAFNAEFQRIFKAGFPNCWDFGGVLIRWEQYNQRLVETKSKVDSSHEKISTLKENIIVNYLKRDFQLLWMEMTLFRTRLNYTGLTNHKISYQWFFEAPHPAPTLWQRYEHFFNPLVLQTIEPSTLPPQHVYHDYRYYTSC